MRRCRLILIDPVGAFGEFEAALGRGLSPCSHLSAVEEETHRRSSSLQSAEGTIVSLQCSIIVGTRNKRDSSVSA